jgi:hypothetical protein
MLLQLRHYPIRLMFLSLLRVLPLLTLFLLLLLRRSIWLLLLLRQLSLRLGRRSCSGTRSAHQPLPCCSSRSCSSIVVISMSTRRLGEPAPHPL